MGEPSPRAKAGTVVFITGLPSSGKSTLAAAIRSELEQRAVPSCTLDSDAVRAALVPSPGYSPGERDAYYATIARLAALLAAQDLIVLVPATAHRAAHRADARAWAPRFIEVHVRTPLDECRRRDAKGLYARAPVGFPGLDLVYEVPEAPDVIAEGGQDRTAVERIVALLGRVGEDDP